MSKKILTGKDCVLAESGKHLAVNSNKKSSKSDEIQSKKNFLRCISSKIPIQFQFTNRYFKMNLHNLTLFFTLNKFSFLRCKC